MLIPVAVVFSVGLVAFVVRFVEYKKGHVNAGSLPRSVPPILETTVWVKDNGTSELIFSVSSLTFS